MNTPTHLRVELGSTGPSAALPPPPLLLPWPGRTVTVRALIAQAVREQCRLLAQQQALAQAEAAVRVARQYLTADEVARLAAEGRVALAPHGLPSPTPEAEPQVQVAWEAFAQSRFMVVVGPQRVTALDEEVTLGFDTAVRFVRLVPLVGG